MAPAEVLCRTSRASTPDPRKPKVGSSSFKENDEQNSPDRRAKTGLVEKKELQKVEPAVKVPTRAQRAWHTIVMLVVTAIVVAVGVAVTPQFNHEAARNFFGTTSLFLVRVAAYLQRAIDGLPDAFVIRFDAAELFRCVRDKTGYFDEAGFFHPSIPRSTLLALAAAQIACFFAWLFGVTVWMPLCSLKKRFTTKGHKEKAA